ncbi:J domain-containing protein [Nocardioides nematodiphilus]|uniref:J domain-containing protein n=1 Tax=Nocardioides nematodiphilus TaxID=2849669 RepID=UPI001CD93449|nr:DnaJ domain-containing protein [Nocardioides nematodiphilus]MCA1984737.1 J domain-containing protein [Nocardioides nematodiphilus]
MTMDLQMAYATLGIDEGVPIREVQQRYRARAQMLHPDRVQGSPKLLDEASRAMAELNAAWEVVADADRRGARHQKTRGFEHAEQEPLRTAGQGECDSCGSFPAALVQYRVVVGTVLFWRTRGVTLELCRTCGLSMFREAQAETMTKGWWGMS